MWCRNSLGALLRNLNRIKYADSTMKRTFLSAAFQCEDSWRKRLDTPLLKKCVLDDFFYELDSKFGHTQNINAIDVDIFVNAVKDDAHLQEMQDLVHKLRLSPDSCNTLPSTHHCIVRTMLDFEQYDDLMNILNDRLNYGIFPDDFCTLLMFDRFLKCKDYRNASKVATLQMLQEDFSDPLVTYLSLYSCHSYLLNPTEWEAAKEDVPQDDEEEVRVRVNYLKNPYFDNHFDLRTSDELIGKTLIMIGRQLNDDLGQSYQLLGSVLFNQLASAESLVKSITGSKTPVHKDVLTLALKHVEGKTAAKDGEDIEGVENFKKLLEELSSKNVVQDKDALPAVEEKVKQLVKVFENDMIAQQKQIYQEWLEERERLLRDTLDNLKKEERLGQVQRVKEELRRREEQLFFFDREDKLDLEIERKLAEGADEEHEENKLPSLKESSPRKTEKRKQLG